VLQRGSPQRQGRCSAVLQHLLFHRMEPWISKKIQKKIF
jgi:hypothetical protein